MNTEEREAHLSSLKDTGGYFMGNLPKKIRHIIVVKNYKRFRNMVGKAK